MTATLQYDYLNRMTQTMSSPSGASAVSFNYAGNAANPRRAVANFDHQYNRWALPGSGLACQSEATEGGVGTLPEVVWITNEQATDRYVAKYDGNGNLACLVSGAGGSLSACYEYGPFGEVIRSTGPMAKVNPFRFSTKFQDDETDLLYYGYRYYNASTGRWISRDPILEKAFLVLRSRGQENQTLIQPVSGEEYAFVRNNPVCALDVLGLSERDIQVLYRPDEVLYMQKLEELNLRYPPQSNMSEIRPTQ